MNKLKLIFLVFWVLSGSGVLAQEVELYSAEVAVADDSPEARKVALRKAFSQVLIKASGYRDIGGRKGTRNLIRKAPNYVQQFKYRTEVDAEGNSERRLWAQFDRHAVNRALAQAGLSVWESRPEVLVWLVQDKQGQRSLVDPELDAGWIEALQQSARQRGMPLLLPLLDLQDRSAIGVSDLWSANAEAIRQASARYGQPMILLGRIKASGEGWVVRWVLWSDENSRQFTSRGKTQQQVLLAGVDQAMTWIGERYRPASTDLEADWVSLRFLGVDSLDHYARLMRILRSVDQQGQVVLERLEDDHLVVKLKVRGGVDMLRQRLSLESDLQPAISINDDRESPTEQDLTYQMF